MVEHINGPGQDRLDRLSPGERARILETRKATEALSSESGPGVVVSSELRGLIDRIKHAETFRKERVHQVMEKLQRGELVTSETVREAAEKILREGT
jgi:uncharacterized protein YheU (UPF0270 family)